MRRVGSFLGSGIAFALLAYAAFALSDACVKALQGRVVPWQLGFYGSALSFLILPLMWRPGDRLSDLIRPRRPATWWLRGGLATVNMFASIIAFSHLPMAEAFALIFLMPLLITILSVLFLRERVNVKAWFAVILGFVGVVTVLRPGFRDIGIGHIAAMLCGLSGAGLFVLLRHTRDGEKRITLFGAGVLCPMMVSFLLMLPGYTPPDLWEWVIVSGYALLAALANMLMMYASRLSPASHLAPTQYSQMLWGVGLGYVLFGDHVDAWTYVGIGLICFAGLWRFLPKRWLRALLPVAPR
ncbi:Pseudopaline exporter CntI (plasmid) [Asticcacaulis sp. MM231]|uniref:DMT family transporter n=1 Tax=Asticcacaulis sp. MM231 TaxID=3157666 RepID=UPI0032D58DC5